MVMANCWWQMMSATPFGASMAPRPDPAALMAAQRFSSFGLDSVCEPPQTAMECQILLVNPVASNGCQLPAGPPILGIHVVVGPSFREKMRNGQKAMVDGRIRLINAVLVRA
jgi:hypothetical protein